MPLNISGNHVYQLPPKVDVSLHPVMVPMTPSQDVNRLERPSRPHYEQSTVLVQRDKLKVTPPLGDGSRVHPANHPLFVIGNGLRANEAIVAEATRQLRDLKKRFVAQAVCTTTIAGSAGSIVAGAGAGFFKGMVAGPKGAVAGCVVGASVNAVSLYRRRAHNLAMEQTLDYFEHIFDLYRTISRGSADATKIIVKLIDLDRCADAAGPAARMAFGELERVLLSMPEPGFAALMRNFAIARNDVRLLENLS